MCFRPGDQSLCDQCDHSIGTGEYCRHMNREHNGALGLKTNTQYYTMPDKYAMNRFYEDKQKYNFYCAQSV